MRLPGKPRSAAASQIVSATQGSHERGALDQRAHPVGEPLRMLDRLAQNRPRSAARFDQTEGRGSVVDFPEPFGPRIRPRSVGNLERQVVHRNEIPEAPNQPSAISGSMSAAGAARSRERTQLALRGPDWSLRRLAQRHVAQAPAQREPDDHHGGCGLEDGVERGGDGCA